MSNEKCSETTVNVELVNVLPYRAESEKQQQKTAEIPAVPVTADLPLLPEFRAREQAINWRAALTSVGLASFLAVIAGVGCGTGTNNMLKPSPATPGRPR